MKPNETISCLNCHISSSNCDICDSDFFGRVLQFPFPLSQFHFNDNENQHFVALVTHKIISYYYKIIQLYILKIITHNVTVTSATSSTKH